MKSLADMLPDGPTLVGKSANCEKHGPYPATLLVAHPEHWSTCPTCNAELKAQKEREPEIARERALAKNLQEAGILRRFQDATFDTYRAQTEGQARILEAVRNYAAAFEIHLGAGRCLGLLGGAGHVRRELCHPSVNFLGWRIYAGRAEPRRRHQYRHGHQQYKFRRQVF